MGDFSGKKWHPHLNEEARERRDEIEDHLEKKYDNPSHFIREKLREEKPLSLEERINRKQQSLSEEQEELERLKRIQREREEQSQLRDKKELLKEKQKKLRNIQERNSSSREEIRSQVEADTLKNKPPRMSDEEYLEAKSERIDRMVESRLDSGEADVDELVESVQRLQREVAELNSGQESWFMDLGQIDEEVKA